MAEVLLLVRPGPELENVLVVALGDRSKKDEVNVTVSKSTQYCRGGGALPSEFN